MRLAVLSSGMNGGRSALSPGALTPAFLRASISSRSLLRYSALSSIGAMPWSLPIPTWSSPHTPTAWSRWRIKSSTVIGPGPADRYGMR